MWVWSAFWGNHAKDILKIWKPWSSNNSKLSVTFSICFLLVLVLFILVTVGGRGPETMEFKILYRNHCWSVNSFDGVIIPDPLSFNIVIFLCFYIFPIEMFVVHPSWEIYRGHQGFRIDVLKYFFKFLSFVCVYERRMKLKLSAS